MGPPAHRQSECDVGAGREEVHSGNAGRLLLVREPGETSGLQRILNLSPHALLADVGTDIRYEQFIKYGCPSWNDISTVIRRML